MSALTGRLHNNGDIMSIHQSHSLLTLLLSLYVAPAFSAEEVTTNVSTSPEGTITQGMARNLVDSGKPGEQAVVIITSPADGSTIKAMARTKLKYRVSGADGIHAQLNIDGKKSVFMRKPIGTQKVAKLSAGVHELCVQAIDKNHKDVGVANCVTVTAQ